MNSSAYLLLILLLITMLPTNTTKVQCQFEPSNWDQDKNYQLSEREEIVSTIYGLDVVVDRLDKTVSQSIRAVGTWEGHLLRTMARFVKPGDTVINIGSHIGLEALVLGRIAGPKGKLLIMQPFSISYNMVLKNVYLNRLAGISTLYQIGASNKYSKGYIAVNNINTGGSGIFTAENADRAPIKTEEVTVDLVDNIIPKDTVIDFALIDVQASEVECLEGMKETILRSPKIIIMCEWAGVSINSRDYKQKVDKLLEWFQSLKFKFYRIERKRPTDCSPLIFQEVSTDYIKSMPDPLDKGAIIDIFFFKEDINPNNVF